MSSSSITTLCPYPTSLVIFPVAGLKTHSLSLHTCVQCDRSASLKHLFTPAVYDWITICYVSSDEVKSTLQYDHKNTF